MRKAGLLILSVILMAGTACTQRTGEMEDVQRIIEKIKEEYAPDTRTVIYDISYSQDGLTLIIKGETNLKEAKEELMSNLKESGYDELVDSVEMLPEKNLGDNTYGVVKLSVCNIRGEHQHSAELVTQSLLGTPVKVYKSRGYWKYIQTPDDYLGWVDGDGIAVMEQNEYDEWAKAEKVIFTGVYGFAYSKPDKNSQTVSDMVAGDILKLTGESGSYYTAEFPDGRKGYLLKSESMPFKKWSATRNPTPGNVINEARRMMGVPYLWGGTSVKGVDCSGFTKTAFFMNGVILPRDASQQVNTGELVDEGMENLKPGDLLFFGRKATEEKKERITHVAIYLGDMHFIHASGYVKIESFNPELDNYNEYRLNSFIRAKRILTSLGSNGVELVKESKLYK